jgi:hypothetical protein
LISMSPMLVHFEASLGLAAGFKGSPGLFMI